MATCFSYVRWSSARQTDGDSLRRQTEAAERWAVANRHTLSDMRLTDAGVSAFRGKNAASGELGVFIAQVRAGRIPRGSYLLIENFDRLSREPVNTALRLFQDIIALGITIVTLTDNQVYSEASINENWTKLIVALAVMSRANEEQERKSVSVRAAWDEKRRKAAGGTIITSNGPSWLQLNADRTGWIVIPERAEVVRRIFQLSAAGNGSLKICIILNDEEVPPLTDVERWTPGAVQSLLGRESVFGRYVQKKVNGAIIDNYYPAILSKQDFDAVQSARVGRRGKGGKLQGISNLFSGMTYCGECGGRMKFYRSGRQDADGNKRPYLRCVTSLETKRKRCQAPSMPYEPMERAILTRIIQSKTSEFNTQKLANSAQDRITQLHQQLVAKQAEMDKLLKLALALGDREVVAVADKMADTQASLDQLQAELGQLREKPISDEEIIAGQELLQRLLMNGTDELRLQAQVTLRRLYHRVSVVVQHPDGLPDIKMVQRYLWQIKKRTVTLDGRQLTVGTDKVPTHLVLMNGYGYSNYYDVTPYL